METITLLTLAALVVKIVSVIKAITPGERNLNLVVTQVVVWVVGIGVLFLAADAEVTEGLVVFGTQSLGAMDGASIVLAGLALGSSGAFAYDAIGSNTEPRLTSLDDHSA